MADLYVKSHAVVEHDGVRYGVNEEAGAKLPGLDARQAEQLLKAGTVQTTDPANGDSKLITTQPTEAEIQQAAEQAGQTSEDQQKRGLFR